MSGNRHDMSDAERHGPYTTRFNRCSRWNRNGTWASIMERLQWLAGGDGGDDGGPPGPVCLHMADSSLMRGHGAGAPRDGAPPQVGPAAAGTRW